MISKYKVKKFCCEDISLIENYYKAINDNQMWHCHHRLEIKLNKSKQELIDLNLYYDRPANELIFLTQSEHRSLHASNRHYKHTEESKEKMRKKALGRKQSEETKTKISESRIGLKHSEETRRKISDSNKGKPQSEYKRYKCGLSVKGKHRVYNDDGTYHYE